MDTLIPLVRILVYVVMAVSVFAALGVVLVRNIFHAALCLIVVLLGVAGIYLALHAEFLAVIQILLYVGGVMTLVIFAIMMTEKMGEKWIAHQNHLMLPGLFAAAFVFLTLFKLLVRPTWPFRAEALHARAGIFEIGTALMGTYVFPFEIISVILIVVLIGALMVAKRDKEIS